MRTDSYRRTRKAQGSAGLRPAMNQKDSRAVATGCEGCRGVRLQIATILNVFEHFAAASIRTSVDC
jgi:hypothetical protein